MSGSAKAGTTARLSFFDVAGEKRPPESEALMVLILSSQMVIRIPIVGVWRKSRAKRGLREHLYPTVLGVCGCA